MTSRKRGTSLAVWLILLLAAAIIFWGIWAYLNSQGQARKHPRVSAITHSMPVGGQTLDGVFHPAPGIGILHSTHWQI